MAGRPRSVAGLRAPAPGARLPGARARTARASSAARAAGAREIAVFTAASETFNRKNINATDRRVLQRASRSSCPRRSAGGLWVRGYVSTCFGCPYEGRSSPRRWSRWRAGCWSSGCDEISIGDTIGVGVPAQVDDVIGPLLDAGRPGARWPSTSTTRAARRSPTCWPRCEVGIAIVDSSAGGLGGCPYAPGASGNLATEDLLYMLHGMGIETGVDLDGVAEASRFILGALGRPPASKRLQAMLARDGQASPWA